MEFSLPVAVLKFRQGVGRLIRTKSDEGIVVVLDNRVLTKRYGQIFLDSLPKCPTEIV
jgi:ATP-dependent DNA helicase DinG